MLQVQRKIQRSLSAELNDDTGRLLFPDDMQNVFQRKRLEIETIGRVVVRGNRLWVAIDHDRFVALFFERERCMAATVIEFDALPDPVWSASENDDLLAVARLRFVFLFVRGV